MNIYFACSLTGGRDDEKIYQIITDHLIDSGHQVPTAFLAQFNIMANESDSSPVEIYTRDAAWIQACDALIAEVSTPSHGVGYEIGYALNLDKPVLGLYRIDTRISKMISGNPDARLTIQPYATPDDAIALINKFLAI